MRLLPAIAAALVLVVAAPAGAAVLRAETVLPPGQSGFVSLTGLPNGTGSPHLYDQTELFTTFHWKSALMNQPGDVESPRDGVTITRDAFGVPDVHAGDEAGMWWGAGYAVAQDRLFQLDLFRHATQGTLSEIVGSSRLDDDRIVRQDFYTGPELDALYAKLPAASRMRFDAYRDGVNAWIDRVRSDPTMLPAEYPATATTLAPWTTRDSVAIGVYLARTIPTNADPESLELANTAALQQIGARWFRRLVPLRPKGSLTTVPARDGRFASQPGRTRRSERRAFRRSARFARSLPIPDAAGAGALTQAPPAGGALARFTPRLGGSYMVAVRRRADGHAFLFNGPQLGFDAPEKLLEVELHAPGIDLRGMTAPGVPVIGAGYNGNGVAWGVTTGASDTDDLYAEKLVPGHPEQYVFRGAVRDMDCRTETLHYDSPPSDLLSQKAPESGTREVRLCRTVHGPVEARAGGYAYARSYSIWMRELDTLTGLATLERAGSISDVDRAMAQVTWNENLMAVDAAGHIGFWHPGLFPIRPRRFDERLPYPGTGQAEWRGVLPPARRPHVIDPEQGWLANWNNWPARGWTSGDGTARKRLDGPLFRVGLLMALVPKVARDPSVDALQDMVRAAGTTAQQRPALTRILRRARAGATGPATGLLDALLAWDGSYARTDSSGTVDPGVAAWDALRAAAADELVRRAGDGAKLLADEDVLPVGGYHHGAPYHLFDLTHLQSQAFLLLKPRALRAAAATAAAALAKRFGSDDPAAWREPRRMYAIGAVGATSPPSIPFFDRGTYEQFVETGR